MTIADLFRSAPAPASAFPVPLLDALDWEFVAEIWSRQQLAGRAAEELGASPRKEAA